MQDTVYRRIFNVLLRRRLTSSIGSRRRQWFIIHVAARNLLI